jgi:hypothetical protein
MGKMHAAVTVERNQQGVTNRQIAKQIASLGVKPEAVALLMHEQSEDVLTRPNEAYNKKAHDRIPNVKRHCNGG